VKETYELYKAGKTTKEIIKIIPGRIHFIGRNLSEKYTILIKIPMTIINERRNQDS
tara:strand:+ start:44 stop:211 length:168 start_codon:yes stop_codon:yes gene_type:complete